MKHLLQRLLGRFKQRPAVWRQPESPLPTPAQVDELLAYLAQLYPHGVAIEPSEVRPGSEWPVYFEVVKAFYAELASDCWTDFNYSIEASHQRVRDPAYIARANFKQLRSLLTYCNRGERFCDGHWGAMIKQGNVRNLLERLAQLRAELCP